jgi:hypothetical protein
MSGPTCRPGCGGLIGFYRGEGRGWSVGAGGNRTCADDLRRGETTDDAGDMNLSGVNHGRPGPESGPYPSMTGEREEPSGFRLPSGGRPDVPLIVVTGIGDHRNPKYVGQAKGRPTHRNHAAGTTRRYV